MTHAGTAPLVLLRCDGTTAGGVGHLVRCLALAEAVRAAGSASVHLAGEISAPMARDLLAASSVLVHPKPADERELLALALGIGAGVIHVDDYGDVGALAAMCRQHGVVLSTATDAEFGRRPADVIVDGAPRALWAFDALYATADTCVGPDYLAVRRSLRGHGRSTMLPDGDLDVLVMMGGTDATGVADDVAEALGRLDGVGRIGIVGGRGSEGVIGVPRNGDLAAVVAGWHLVVTAAGTSVWELATLRVPMAVVGVTENQRDHYDILRDADMAIPLGFLPDRRQTERELDLGPLVVALSDHAILGRCAAAAGRLVDGRGAERIVTAWSEAWLRRSRDDAAYVARTARLTDLGRLFAWRNDDETRRSSRSTTAVAWADHVAWVTDTIDRADRYLFVVDQASEPRGTVRFDRVDAATWEISITVAPSARGAGRAAPLAEAATRAFRAMIAEDAAGEVGRLVAAVRTANAASRALFERLGYRRIGGDERWETWVRDLPERNVPI